MLLKVGVFGGLFGLSVWWVGRVFAWPPWGAIAVVTAASLYAVWIDEMRRT